MANFSQQAVNVQKITGTSGSETYETVQTYTFDAISLGSTPSTYDYSNELCLRLKFPDTFSNTPTRMKVWKNSGQPQSGYSLMGGFDASYTEPISAGSGASTIATAELASQLATCQATGYSGPAYNSTDKSIEFIYLQMKAEGGSAAFNSSNSKRPFTISFAFDRGDTDILSKDYATGLINDITLLSSWDLYLVDSNSDELLVGYMDSTYGINELMESAELLNGLPQSVIATGITRVGAEITGALQIFDPYIQNMVGHYSITDKGQTLRLTQTNSFKEIDEYHFILRAYTTGGHLVEFHIPAGQIYRNGDSSVGGTEFTTFPVIIKANAQQYTGITNYWDVSQRPVQTLKLVINYSGA